jgi:hypothetical protein
MIADVPFATMPTLDDLHAQTRLPGSLDAQGDREAKQYQGHEAGDNPNDGGNPFLSHFVSNPSGA